MTRQSTLTTYLMGLGAIVSACLFSSAAIAQSEPFPSEIQIDELTVLESCAAGTVTSDLPNPFIDLFPTDWAYEAVLTMYYCGPYRGAIPPEQLLEFREAQRS
ncbi:MAG: hypothetical protein AAFX40_02880 [Cyanobacteria bacterium J06639_1]